MFNEKTGYNKQPSRLMLVEIGICLVFIVAVIMARSNGHREDSNFEARWNAMQPLEIIKMGLGKRTSQYISKFSFEDVDIGCLSSPLNYRDQDGCGTCVFHAITAAMEVEVKRRLYDEDHFVFSKFDINLSESEFLRHWGYNELVEDGVDPLKVLNKMTSEKWIIPLERYSCFRLPNNCNYSTLTPSSNMPGAILIDYGQVCDREDVEYMKYVLYYLHKATLLSKIGFILDSIITV